MAFAHHMIALVDRIPEHLTDNRTAPGVIAHLGFYRAFDTGNGNLMFQQIFGNPHHSVSVCCQVENQLDGRGRLRVNNQMAVVCRVTHEAVGSRSTQKLPLPGAGHPARQYLLGNIPAIHIIQDIFERGNVHLLPVQTVHSISDSDITDVVTREKDFDVAASLDIVRAQP